MPKIADMEIAGKSGTKYSFEVYPIDSTWNDVKAVYVITKRSKKPDSIGGTHAFIYVGETDNLKKRHSGHHKADCFKKNEANCLCVLLEGNSDKRLAIEKDLKDNYEWPCND